MRLIPVPASGSARFLNSNTACLKNSRLVSKQDIRRWWAVWLLAGFTLATGNVRGELHAGQAPAHETLIRISTARVASVTHLYVQNVQAAEVTVTLEMDLVNLSPSVTLPCTTTLAGKQKLELLTLTPDDPAKGWSWTYTYYSTFGSTKARHDDSYVYSLPFSPGRSYRVSQGYNGEYSHFGVDQYAIDWRMPVGTPVYAARDGVVVGVKNDSDIGGGDSHYDWDANYILIQHSDDTLGQYVHLMKGGTAVQVGQRVKAGEYIGRSGNTGHSTGPHLHFSVFKARDGKHRETIPVRFRTANEYAVTPLEGHAYRAAGTAAFGHGGQEDGAALVNSIPVTPSWPARETDAVGGLGGQAVGH